ncbi:MAG: hypothetical protein J7499_19850 [Sphingopyxis sp.]|nr:hypothetical protein [Sphingopyxis sp.]
MIEELLAWDELAPDEGKGPAPEPRQIFKGPSDLSACGRPKQQVASCAGHVMRWCSILIISIVPTSMATAQHDAGPPNEKYVGEGKLPDLFRVANQKSCINGHNPFAENTTARIRGLAEQTLANYIALAGSAPEADVRSVYTNKKKTHGWGDNSFKIKPISISWIRDGAAGDLVAVDDPLAHVIALAGAKHENSLQMEAFLVSGVKMTAMGAWRIIDPRDPDRILGRYRARFIRENSLGGQAWSLISMEVFTNPDVPAEVLQYCAEPGDVERNQRRMQIEAAERERRQAERANRR